MIEINTAYNTYNIDLNGPDNGFRGCLYKLNKDFITNSNENLMPQELHI